MISKRCPSCGYAFTLRRYFRLNRYRFPCPGCSAPLATDSRRAILAVVLQAPLLAWVVSQAVRNPWYWAALLPVSVACFLIHYGCFAIAADAPRRG